MSRRVPAFVLLLAMAGCTRACERKTAAAADATADEAGPRDAGADAADAEVTRTGAPSELSASAIASFGSRLHVLADGAVLYSHGLTVERLHDDGRREHLATLRVPLDMPLEVAPIGTAAGTLDDGIFVSVVEDQYPATMIARSSRVTRTGEAERVFRDDVFYLDVARWSDGRLLALRAKGAVRWFFNSAPWMIDRFVVIAGAPANAPRIPPKTFIEGFVAFESGVVLAAATSIDAALIDRRGALVLRWSRDGGAPTVERPKSNEGDFVEHIAARTEDDVWIAGRSSDTDFTTAWLQHWDGKAWTREDAPFEGWVKSISIARDGTVWAVSNGMIGRVRNELHRRAAGAAGAWTRVELPDPKEATFAKPPPRMAYLSGAVRVDRRRAPPSAVLEPIQVVARSATIVWVVAQTDLDGTLSTVLLRTGGSDRARVDDLDEEATTFAEDKSVPAGSKCASLFVSAGEPTEPARSRVKASSNASSGPVVIARLDGKRVLGSATDSREAADELASTWRKLALPAEIRCARPPIVELVFDPDARDE